MRLGFLLRGRGVKVPIETQEGVEQEGMEQEH